MADDPKKSTIHLGPEVHAFSVTPEAPITNPYAQAEELARGLLVPLADLLRARGDWHPAAIHLALFRVATHCFAADASPEVLKTTLEEAWDDLMELLKEDMHSTYAKAATERARLQALKDMGDAGPIQH